MADLTTNEKQILEKLFQMSGGYVLNFTDRTFGEYFRDDLKIDIYNPKYNYASGSKANRMRGFWLKATNRDVSESIVGLIEYIKTQTLIDGLPSEDFPPNRVIAALDIADRLYDPTGKTAGKSKATFENGNINILLQADIFDHVKELLANENYFHAVEESYKIVRKRLKDITGQERATDAFCAGNIKIIFGHEPSDEPEKDFFEGVKFLHMAIQFLRNEKAHTPASPMDKNLAIHYISLASLAYDLITRNNAK
jgi:uncharacterized protein (TIGR02391 family)